MSRKDQGRRMRLMAVRGRRGGRRVGAMLLRQLVVHPVDVPHLVTGDDGLLQIADGLGVADHIVERTDMMLPAFLEDEDLAL